MSTILSIKDLNAGYGDIQILKNVSLKLKEGSITILMGPNGAGKSTLIKSIFNLTDITKGSIAFKNQQLTDLQAYELISLGIAFVSQGKVNFGTLNIEENLTLGAHHVKDKQEVQKRLTKIYKQFPALKQKKSQYAFSLSGGEQQMLAIGRALMSNPTLLLMDEPSLGLAPKLVKEVFDHIKDIRDNFDTTILVVEHNIKSLFNIADEACVLVNGKIVAHDSCKNLLNSDIMKEVFVGALD